MRGLVILREASNWSWTNFTYGTNWSACWPGSDGRNGGDPGGRGRCGGSEAGITDNASSAGAPQHSAASTGQRPPLGEGTPPPLGGPIPVAPPWLQGRGGGVVHVHSNPQSHSTGTLYMLRVWTRYM